MFQEYFFYLRSSVIKLYEFHHFLFFFFVVQLVSMESFYNRLLVSGVKSFVVVVVVFFYAYFFVCSIPLIFDYIEYVYLRLQNVFWPISVEVIISVRFLISIRIRSVMCLLIKFHLVSVLTFFIVIFLETFCVNSLKELNPMCYQRSYTVVFVSLFSFLFNLK